MFADDLKLTSKISTTGSDLSHLQEDIKRLQIWSETNLLLFNMKRCGFINFKLNGQTRYNSPNEFSFSINNCKIPKVVAAKDLGLIISESLNWSEHIQSRIAKGTKTLFLLKRNTSFLINEKSKSYLYRATINPTLLYASECWTANISDMKAIESFNKKVMLWINPNLSYFECLVTNNLLPPMYFQVLKDLLLYRKILDGK